MGARLSFTGRYNWYLVFDITLLGVATITETSFQTVDSGQVEDTRCGETSSDVVKVSIFSLGNGETGDIIKQLCNKAINC